MVKKKDYSAPEVDIEKFSIPTSVMTSAMWVVTASTES